MRQMTLALVTGLTARRRTQANDTEEDRRRSKAVDGLTRVLRQALDEEEVQLSALPANRHYSTVWVGFSFVFFRLVGLQASN